VDGSVQQLAIHTEGGVVTPDSRLEIEAMVSNRDIGYAEIAVEENESGAASARR
jgi:hemolysin D